MKCMSYCFVLAVIAMTGLSAKTFAQGGDRAPTMAKSESGVPLDADFDWAMCAPDGVAVGGYDLVSYRDPEGPETGDPVHAADHGGRTYWFADAANRERFLDDPESFLPAYAGFCAITLALGRVTCPEYTNFKIENDRLLLFEVTGFTNGRTLWNSDASGFRRHADTNFEQLTERR